MLEPAAFVDRSACQPPPTSKNQCDARRAANYGGVCCNSPFWETLAKKEHLSACSGRYPPCHVVAECFTELLRRHKPVHHVQVLEESRDSGLGKRAPLAGLEGGMQVLELRFVVPVCIGIPEQTYRRVFELRCAVPLPLLQIRIEQSRLHCSGGRRFRMPSVPHRFGPRPHAASNCGKPCWCWFD